MPEGLNPYQYETNFADQSPENYSEENSEPEESHENELALKEQEITIEPISPDWTNMTPEQLEQYETEAKAKREFLLNYFTSLQQEYESLQSNNPDEFRNLFFSSPYIKKRYEGYCQLQREYAEKYNKPVEIVDLTEWFNRIPDRNSGEKDNYCPVGCIRRKFGDFGYYEDFHTQTLLELIARFPNLSVETFKKIADKQSDGDVFSKGSNFIDTIIELQPARGLKILEIGGNAIAYSASDLGASTTYYGCDQHMSSDSPYMRRGFYGTGEKLTLVNWQEAVPAENDFVITERVFSDPGTGVAVGKDHEMGAADLTAALWNCTRPGGYAIHNDVRLLDKDYQDDIGWQRCDRYQTTKSMRPDDSWYDTTIIVEKKTEPKKTQVAMPEDTKPERADRVDLSFDEETKVWKSKLPSFYYRD